MIRTAKAMIMLAMVVALAMPVMAQVNITETIDCDVCNLSKCQPVDLGCVSGASQTSSGICPLWGDAYQVTGLALNNCIDTTVPIAIDSNTWWNVNPGAYSNRPNGAAWNIYCPVIFDICNCEEAIAQGAFTAGSAPPATSTRVGIEMTIVTKTASGSYVYGDNGVYFGEAYSGNVIMSNNRSFLCNPICTTTPVAVTMDDNLVPYTDGSAAWRLPLVNTFWRFSNILGTAGIGPQYWLANDVAGAWAAPVCAPAAGNKVVKITTDYVLPITAVDEDRGLSRWALDIPTIYVTKAYTECTTIAVEILIKTDLGGSICADCRTECICIEDLYQTCCDAAVSSSTCVTFNYFAKLDGTYANGIVIVNPSNTENLNVDLTLYEKDGDVGTYSLNTAIAPNGMYLNLVENIPWVGSGVGDSQCYVVAVGDNTIDGFGYFWDEEGHSMGYLPRTWCVLPSN